MHNSATDTSVFRLTCCTFTEKMQQVEQTSVPPESYCAHLKQSSNHKKDSSDFSLFYNRKIYFIVKILIFMLVCHDLAQALVFFAEISTDKHEQIRSP